MDLNAMWQENRRFALALAAGAAVFAGGWIAIDSVWGQTLADARRERTGLSSKLARDPLYTRADQSAAAAENELLLKSIDTLSAAVAFESRAYWRVDSAAGSASSQYHAAIAATQAELLPLCSRANLGLDRALGLPALSPTREDEIERYLQALDLIERAVRMAVACEVARIDEIQIKLDPALYTRAGASRIERTSIKLTATGSGQAIARFLRRTQEPDAAPGKKQGLLLDEVEVLPTRSNTGESRLIANFVVARLRPTEEQAE